ncbi:MAG: helix-turn-helix transcriptional regulator [Clostridia bacterium]|nr:helix-turn-helix transcriptional regulator [Clostridia bacterium]
MYFDEEILNFCRNVKFLRENNNLSKKEMAKILGIGIGRLTKVEKGEIPERMSANVIINICNYFDVLPNKLFEKILK